MLKFFIETTKFIEVLYNDYMLEDGGVYEFPVYFFILQSDR